MAEKSIGALWIGKDKIAFSGNIEIDGQKIKIVVFKNDYKDTDRHPDYKIYRSKERADNPPKAQDNMGLSDNPPDEVSNVEPF